MGSESPGDVGKTLPKMLEDLAGRTTYRAGLDDDEKEREMKSCKGCKYADWERTKAGRLHPTGGGTCIFYVKMPALPNSMYWLLGAGPSFYGGSINRYQEFKTDCPCWMPLPDPPK